MARLATGERLVFISGLKAAGTGERGTGETGADAAVSGDGEGDGDGDGDGGGGGDDNAADDSSSSEVIGWATSAVAALHSHDEAVVVGTRKGGAAGIDWESDDVSLDAPLAFRRSALLALGGADPVGACPEDAEGERRAWGAFITRARGAGAAAGSVDGGDVVHSFVRHSLSCNIRSTQGF